jgi:alpha-1,2-mannosyltransferase
MTAGRAVGPRVLDRPTGPTSASPIEPASPKALSLLAVRDSWMLALVGVLAFGLRLWPVLEGGRLKGNASYDDGVYYAAAREILAGRVPYRDFVLLHPPALPYLLVPFAELGRLMGDANGWAVARVAFMVVGAASAVLAVWVGSRFGRWTGLACGVVYAVWAPGVVVENAAMLEVVPSLLLLVALGLLGSRRPSPLALYAAGAAVGAGACFKIWGVVPLAVLLLWQLLGRGRSQAGRVAAGAAAGGLAICGPTLVLAGPQMWRMVIVAQLTRVHGPPLELRLARISSVAFVLPDAASTAQEVGLAVAAVVVLACAALALATPGARVYVALLLATTLVLAGSPPYYWHYGELVAAPAALVLGVGLSRLAATAGRVRRVGRAAAVPAAVLLGAVVVAQVVGDVQLRVGTAFPGAQVHALAATQRCVVSDSPAALVQSDLLSRDLARGCPVRVDVSGATYAGDRAVGAHGTPLPRLLNPVWQKDIRSYLMSQPMVILDRRFNDGLSPATMAALHRVDDTVLTAPRLVVLERRKQVAPPH